MFHLPGTLRSEIIAHARSAYPNECCGLLLGVDAPSARQIHRALPIPNASDHPHNHYLISPRAYLAAQSLADSLHLEILGVYHSHPNHPALPSATDRASAFDFLSYLILSINSAGLPHLASFRLTAGVFLEEPIHPVPSA